MTTVCNKNMCNGCMACIEKCPVSAITLKRHPKAYNAIIDEKRCVSCKACYSVCPRNKNDLQLVEATKWYQGWAKDSIRNNSTSGGVASAVMTAFMESGGYVCSCLFKNGDFVFELSRDIKTIEYFAGSKYVKSNPTGIYSKIQRVLSDGNKVLFLGLPCQVAALKNYIKLKYQDKLYTIDLICHGTPDISILRKYLNDHGVDVESIENISFRKKNNCRVQSEYKSVVPSGVVDRYLYTFLKKINYTENCYSCQFANTKRISDLTLGDSWGSVLPIDEQRKGISILLLQTKKGKELVEMSNLTLFDVNVERAVQNNAQLHTSASMPKSRDKFFSLYEKDLNFDDITFRIAPKMFVRQNIKETLLKLHIISGRHEIYNISVKSKNE